MVTSVIVAPGNEHYARRASSFISWKLGRRVQVRSRTRVAMVPWQVSAASLLGSWLTFTSWAVIANPLNVWVPPIFYGPAFNGSFGNHE